MRLSGCARMPALMNPPPVLPSEILAWATLQRVCLTPWEVDVLLDLDAASLQAAQDLRDEKAPKGQTP